MLKISIDVKSGIKEFVVPARERDSYIEKFKLRHNEENRHLFLQGVLLYLMGERISLYELNKDIQDTDWQLKTEMLKNFLKRIELKGRIREPSSNIDTMTFSQYRKHGVTLYSNYRIDRNALMKVGASRLNPKYAPFVKSGLFDVFELPEVQLVNLLKNSDWKSSKEKISEALISTINNDEAFDDRNIIRLQEAKELLKKLSDVFTVFDFSEFDDGKNKNTYLNVLNFFLANDKQLNILNKKKNGFKLAIEKRTVRQQNKIDSALKELNKLMINQIRFSYFMWRYLQMYVALFESRGHKPKCTSFGIAGLNYKNKENLKDLLDWFDDPLKAFKAPSNNAFGEFHNGLFLGSKYGVSFQAPVQSVKYDGIFELFIKSDLKTEEFIQKQIENSGRWYLRVGKLCLASLHQAPETFSDDEWNSLVDDG